MSGVARPIEEPEDPGPFLEWFDAELERRRRCNYYNEPLRSLLSAIGWVEELGFDAAVGRLRRWRKSDAVEWGQIYEAMTNVAAPWWEMYSRRNTVAS